MTLDGLLGAGVLAPDDLDGLSGTQLLRLAREAVQHQYEGFEMPHPDRLRRTSRKAA